MGCGANFKNMYSCTCRSPSCFEFGSSRPEPHQGALFFFFCCVFVSRSRFQRSSLVVSLLWY